MTQGLGVTQKVTTPLSKERLEDAEIDDAETKLYRLLTMRIGYISHDKCDMQRVVRDLARGMAQPTERHFMMQEGIC